MITVVETLSPSNKRARSRSRAIRGQAEELLQSTAHFVEIDLLRGGRPMPLEKRPNCDYSVLVSRAEARPRAGFWPIALRRLPVIPIPLRPGDPDARIDLQEILDHVYDSAGYADFIYATRPEPASLQKTPPGPAHSCPPSRSGFSPMALSFYATSLLGNFLRPWPRSFTLVSLGRG